MLYFKFIEEKHLKNGIRRRLKRATETTITNQPEVEPEVQVQEPKPVTETPPKIETPQKILMVETSNLIHLEYKQT